MVHQLRSKNRGRRNNLDTTRWCFWEGNCVLVVPDGWGACHAAICRSHSQLHVFLVKGSFHYRLLFSKYCTSPHWRFTRAIYVYVGHRVERFVKVCATGTTSRTRIRRSWLNIFRVGLSAYQDQNLPNRTKLRSQVYYTLPTTKQVVPAIRLYLRYISLGWICTKCIWWLWVSCNTWRASFRRHLT